MTGDNNLISENRSNHKRQRSVGLGLMDSANVILDPKTIVKPPPLKMQYPNNTGEIRSFADRIRAIVLHNRKNPPVTPISATLAPLSSKSRLVSFFKKFHVEKFKVSEEAILPLPSPLNDAAFEYNALIPLVSLSPDFSSDRHNIIPSIKDEPMLGDIETAREQKFPSPQVNEASLQGKQIWKFRLKHQLGKGAFSTVYLAEDLEEGGFYAVKAINKVQFLHDERIKSSVAREVGVHKLIRHDKIAQLEATMETKDHLCLILEYVQGGELFDFVKLMHGGKNDGGIQSNIDEILIKKLVLELIEVVIWLHDHNIVHRDIKLENVMVYIDALDEPHIKLTDFGLARVFDPSEPKLTTRCGSPEYAAPEIVQHLDYDGRLTDTWCIGVVIYAMLVGYLPFDYDLTGKSTSLFQRIVMAQVIWPDNENISEEAKEVVERILVRHPDKRLTLREVVELPWFKIL